MCPGNSTPANKMRIELADENAEPSSKKGSWLFLPVSFLSDGAEARNLDHKLLTEDKTMSQAHLAGPGQWTLSVSPGREKCRSCFIHCRFVPNTATKQCFI